MLRLVMTVRLEGTAAVIETAHGVSSDCDIMHVMRNYHDCEVCAQSVCCRDVCPVTLNVVRGFRCPSIALRKLACARTFLDVASTPSRSSNTKHSTFTLLVFCDHK